MTRTIITTTFIAAVSAAAVGFLAAEARAEEGPRAAMRDVPPGQFFVDCWIGMKWGDQPGQLIRGWICERPFIPAPQTASGALNEEEDVAKLNPRDARR